MLTMWTCKRSNPTVIKVPTSSLDLNKLRFRPFIQACKEGMAQLDVDTMQTGSKLVKEGLPLSELSKYANTNEPLEFVYLEEINPKIFAGYTETPFSENPMDMIKGLFG